MSKYKIVVEFWDWLPNPWHIETMARAIHEIEAYDDDAAMRYAYALYAPSPAANYFGKMKVIVNKVD